MIDSSDKLLQLLQLGFITVIILLFVLVVVFIYLKIKMNREVKAKADKDKENNKSNTKNKKTNNTIDRNSVFDFMEFDKIEDNMILRKNETRFVMVLQCNGINYDLILNEEKIAVEEGFIQFLNSLRYPIQLYIQTRKVNLEQNIQKYETNFKDLENNFVRKQLEFENLKRDENITDKELRDKFIDLKREANIYEYTKDIIQNTKNMSLNGNILTKFYYIVLTYSPLEESLGDYDKNEIKDRAFNELYTRAKSISRVLAGTGVNSKILNSYELADLLYEAYNREQAETYGIDKIINSRYTDLYITAPDVLDKKEKMLDEKIQKEAKIMADREMHRLKSEKEKRIQVKQENMEEIVSEMAKFLLEQQKNEIGEQDTEKIIKNIQRGRKKKVS